MQVRKSTSTGTSRIYARVKALRRKRRQSVDCVSTSKASIVLVHGVWADASSFNRVIPVLHEEDYEVVAPQFGPDTLASDVDAVERALRRFRSPTILVGHSYGGTLITAAGVDNRVAGLVYIAALAPDADEPGRACRTSFQSPTSSSSITSKSQMGYYG
jgi:pimeloyl-ACP methyl ester carboxylesterase